MTAELETIRANVRKELPELELIQDTVLRNLAVEAWSVSLSKYGFSAISELQGSGAYDILVLKEGTQVDHLRGVTRIALAIAREFAAIYPDMLIDFDAIIAGGLLHDVGKPIEYNCTNRHQWTEHPEIEGSPAVRHSVQGYHICSLVGLPLKIAHIVGSHSKEGGFIHRSLEASIVHTADELYWNTLKNAGKIKEGTF